MLDFPDKTACVVFTPGCNFRCGYCHNSEFVLPELIEKIKHNFIPEEVFFNFLRQRVGKLDGVVISGGEPTLMADLPAFIQKVKNFGFAVKLDTNGNNPEMLEKITSRSLVDYIAMDVKTCLDKYQELAGELASIRNIKKSIELIQKSGIPYEFRSTLVKEIHPPAVLERMARLLNGSNVIYLQQFRPLHTLDPEFENYHAFSKEEMEGIADMFKKYAGEAEIRI